MLPVLFKEEIWVASAFYPVLLLEAGRDGEIVPLSQELKSDFIAESVVSLVKNLVNKQKELTRSTAVELATGTKVLKKLSDMSFNEDMSAIK